MAEEQIRMTVDVDHQIANLIHGLAIYQAKCRFKRSDDVYTTQRVEPDDIRDAANLTFLTMDLIAEWHKGR